MKKITYKSNFVKQQRQKKNQAKKKKMKTKNELLTVRKKYSLQKLLKNIYSYFLNKHTKE